MCVFFSPFEQFHLSVLSLLGASLVIVVAAWVFLGLDDVHVVAVDLGARLGARMFLVLVVVVGGIGVLNFCGLVPLATVFTASLVGALWLGVGVWIYRGLVGLVSRCGVGFRAVVGHWLVGPFALVALFVPLEVVGFVMPVVSLGVRLFANIMAGHVLLHVFAGFATLAFGGSVLGGCLLLAVMLCLIVLESAVAGIQAYVFGLLMVVYTSDAVNPASVARAKYYPGWPGPGLLLTSVRDRFNKPEFSEVKVRRCEQLSRRRLNAWIKKNKLSRKEMFRRINRESKEPPGSNSRLFVSWSSVYWFAFFDLTIPYEDNRVGGWCDVYSAGLSRNALFLDRF